MILGILGDMMEQYSLNSFAFMATGCVTVLTLFGLLKVQQESRRRQSVAAEIAIAEATKKKTVDREKYPGGRITVYYATQTGTAESFAQQLEREGPEQGFYIHIQDMEEVTMEDMKERPPFDDGDDDDDEAESETLPSRAIILAATYGEGEPTDNSTELVNEMKEWLNDEEKEDDSSTQLRGIEYCVFGLGNRQYEHFNAMGIFFDSALDKMGATRIFEMGMGDDDKDLEADFEGWKDQMWNNLRTKYCGNAKLPAKSQTTDEFKLPQCEYVIEYHKQESSSNHNITIPDHIHGSSKPFFTSVDCPVVTNRELRSEQDGGSTVHIEIDTTNKVSYQTADNLGVLPVNNADVVQSVADALGYDLEAVFSLKAAPDTEWHGAPFPMPITVRECLTRYLDLTSAPRRSDLKLLVQYAKESLDRKALQRLSSKEGKKEYKEKITEGYVGMVDLLKLCPSLSIPLEHFISVCHFLLPRFYTISSSSSEFPNQVHLTVSVTTGQRKDGSTFNGVCSTHLAQIKPNSTDMVRVFNRASTFRLPADSTRPIIMIGPGTGIAPMRALLQERRYQRNVEKKEVGSNILYFGCKKRDLDYLYREELEGMQSEGVLTTLHLAFSREQKEKQYVQHLLSQNSKETWNLIDNEKASIYVCGGVRMGHDVSEVLKEIVSNEGSMTAGDTKLYMEKLSREGRFVQELWA